MAVGIPGIGMVRFLSIGVGLNDQFSAAAARLNAQVHGLSTSLAGVDKHVNLIRSKMILLGFATATVIGGIGREFALQERQLSLAAFAAGDYASNIKDVEKSVVRLSSGLKLPPIEMAKLVKQVNQLGVGNIEGAATALSRAGAMLQKVTDGEVEAAMAAETIFRLASATASTDEEFRHLLQSAPNVASAIQVVGTMSAAGTPDILQLIAALQPLGTIAGFTTEQLIALAGGLGDVNATSRELFRTALMRMFGDTFLDPEKVGHTVEMLRTLEGQAGLTTEQFHDMRRARPFDLLLLIAKAMKQFPKGERVELLQAMGLTQRDAVTLSATAQSLGKILDMQIAIDAEMGKGQGKTALDEQVDILNNQLLGAWEGFTAAVSRAAKTIGGTLAPVLTPLLKTLEALFTILSQSKMLSALVAYGGIALVVGQMVRLSAMLAPMTRGVSSLFKTLLGGEAMLGGGLGRRLGLSQVIGKATRGRADNLSDLALLASGALMGPMPRGLKGRMGRLAQKFGVGRMLRFHLGTEGTASGAERALNARNAFMLNRTMADKVGTTVGKTAGRSLVARIGIGLKAFGERVVNKLGGKGAGMTARFLGERAGTFVASRGVLAAVPVVGQILAALSLLAPVFDGLGNFFDRMADQAGPLGFVVRLLSLLFRVLGFLGNVVNKVIDVIWEGLKKVFGFVGKYTGLSFLFEQLDQGINAVSDSVASASDRLKGADEVATPAPTQENRTSITNTFVNQQGSNTSWEQANRQNAYRAANYAPVGSTRGTA